MKQRNAHSTREAWPVVDLRDQRIGVVLLTSSLERGGAERQVVELANALDADRYRVHVCSLSSEVPLAPALRDVEHRLIIEPKRHKYDLGLILRIAKLLKHLRADIVHSFMFDAEMVGRLAGRLSQTPAVICSNRCPHLFRAAHKLLLARMTHGCFDVMVANSHAGYEFERDRQRVAEEKLRVVPNGVDTDKFSPGDGTAMRRSLGIAPEAPVIGMFAHFRGNKDHRTLIEAAASVLSEKPEALFLFAGQTDGGEASQLFGQVKQRVQALGISNQVRFLGDRSDVAELYRVLDIKVLSTFYEGTPNVVLEAMAAGLPVIATDVCDNARVVQDGRTGYIVPKSDPNSLARRILCLLTDDALRSRLGAEARRRAQQEFSVQSLGRRTGEVYLQVLCDKGRLHDKSIIAMPVEGGA